MKRRSFFATLLAPLAAMLTRHKPKLPPCSNIDRIELLNRIYGTTWLGHAKPSAMFLDMGADSQQAIGYWRLTPEDELEGGFSEDFINRRKT